MRSAQSMFSTPLAYCGHGYFWGCSECTKAIDNSVRKSDKEWAETLHAHFQLEILPQKPQNLPEATEIDLNSHSNTIRRSSIVANAISVREDQARRKFKAAGKVAIFSVKLTAKPKLSDDEIIKQMIENIAKNREKENSSFIGKKDHCCIHRVFWGCKGCRELQGVDTVRQRVTMMAISSKQTRKQATENPA